MRIQSLLVGGLLALGVLLGASCSSLGPASSGPTPRQVAAVSNIIAAVQARLHIDPHVTVFDFQLVREERRLALAGDVESAEMKALVLAAVREGGWPVLDRVRVLPDPALASQPWALGNLSVANVRDDRGHKTEMGTQILMGHPVRLWKSTTNWFLVQTSDRYLGWTDGQGLTRCTAEQLEAWQRGPLLIVTANEDCVREQPERGASPVSDVVRGGLVRQIAAKDGWVQVGLPDGRTGFLPEGSAQNYAAWQASRRPTAENIERTAREFMGRPYLWGGNSPRGMDCSGFTKFVFFQNGVDLLRNASHQAAQGTPVPLDADLTQLRKGDLLFFGHRATPGKPERVTHVGIYLGDKLFIHSSGRVRVNSLDPASPLRDENRIKSLLQARRVLSER